MKRIEAITLKGISYIDESGNQGFVDFKECNDNWIHFLKTKEKLTHEQAEERNKFFKHVGRRDCTANPMYIEFFTRPFTRFEFVAETNSIDPKEAFDKLRDAVYSAGWSTLDLS